MIPCCIYGTYIFMWYGLICELVQRFGTNYSRKNIQEHNNVLSAILHTTNYPINLKAVNKYENKLYARIFIVYMVLYCKFQTVNET